MGKRLPNDASNWGSKGGGMHKHRTGTHNNHNHRQTIELNREAAKELERQAEIRAKRKGKLYSSVKEVFKDL